MDLDERFADVISELRAQAGARHRVPLVPHAAGIEHERQLRRGRRPQSRFLGSDQTRSAVARVKFPVAKEAAVAAGFAVVCRPLHRFERVKLLVRQPCQSADIEIADAVIFKRRQRGMLAEDIGGRVIRKVFAEA